MTKNFEMPTQSGAFIKAKEQDPWALRTAAPGLTGG